LGKVPGGRLGQAPRGPSRGHHRYLQIAEQGQFSGANDETPDGRCRPQRKILSVAALLDCFENWRSTFRRQVIRGSKKWECFSQPFAIVHGQLATIRFSCVHGHAR
jgi:hypothetical protein